MSGLTREMLADIVSGLRHHPQMVRDLLTTCDPPPSWFIPGTNLMDTGNRLDYYACVEIAANGPIDFKFDLMVPMWVSNVVWSAVDAVTGAPFPRAVLHRVQVGDTILMQALQVNNQNPTAMIGPSTRVFTERQTEEGRLWFADNRSSWHVIGQLSNIGGNPIAVQLSIGGYRIHTPGNPAKPNVS